MSDPNGFPYREKRGQTHYADCFRVARHHNCAVARVEELEAENAELRALVTELADDLEAELRPRYGADAPEGVHPALEGRFVRDMDVVERARAALHRRARPEPARAATGKGE